MTGLRRALLVSLGLHAAAFAALAGSGLLLALLGASSDGESGWNRTAPVVWQGAIPGVPAPSGAPEPLPPALEGTGAMPALTEASDWAPALAPLRGSGARPPAAEVPPPLPRRPAGGDGSAVPVQGQGESLGSPGGAPGPRFSPRPGYPEQARRQRLEGTATVTMTVSADGKVVEVRLVASSGHLLLDQEAMATLARWSFSPRAAGAPAVELVQQVVFRLSD